MALCTLKRTMLPPILIQARDIFMKGGTCTGRSINYGKYFSFPFIQRLFSSDVSCTSLDDVVDYMMSGRVKKVAVMAGAGISTASGIPDFRSPGSGLYDNIAKYNLPYPEAIFDIDYFGTNPEPFFSLSQELYPSGVYRPNEAHYFVKLLEEKKLLLRMYTQNIDGLERIAGVSPDLLIEAHGTYATATCQTCLQTYTGEEIKEDILNGKVPRCGKKTCKGVVKPDIVFFGEQLPKSFYYHVVDMPQADILIIMGTSLEVYPFAGIADLTRPGVPRVLFNMEAAGPFENYPRKNDVLVAGDLSTSIQKFCDKLGWKKELEDTMDRNEKAFKSES